MKCGTEKEMDEIIDALDRMGGQKISEIAEELIFIHYSLQQVVPPTAKNPLTTADGTSVFKDEPKDNVGEMIKFLKKHNPNADDFVLQQMRNMAGGGVNVPDWILHRPAQETFEFYEVKPASRSGKDKGKTKVMRLEALFGSDPALRHYSAGHHYSRRGSTAAFTISKGVMATEVSLEWEPGSVKALIIYTICSDSKLKAPKVSPEAQRNIFLASMALTVIMIAIVAPGGLLGPLAL